MVSLSQSCRSSSGTQKNMKGLDSGFRRDDDSKKA
jgi:hypothetical protein